MKRLKAAVFAILIVFIMPLSLPAGKAFAGDFRVYPIRLDLDRDAKSGAVKILNEGVSKLNVQMKLFEWTQDESGKDAYAESTGLIFFPRSMTVEPNEERVLRVGIKAPAVSREIAYRLFVEEMPELKKPGGKGAQVAVAIRFGLPVFVRPVNAQTKGEITSAEVSKGVLNVTVENPGNVSFSISTIRVVGRDKGGKETFTRDMNGWYLLSGAKRLYSTPLEAACAGIERLEIEVKTVDFSLNKGLDMTAQMCAQ